MAAGKRRAFDGSSGRITAFERSALLSQLHRHSSHAERHPERGAKTDCRRQKTEDAPMRKEPAMSAEIKTLHEPDLPLTSLRVNSMNMKICSVENCTREHLAKGLCNSHYSRMRRGLPIDAPKYTKIGTQNPRWNGGKTKRNDGRVSVYAPKHPKARNGRYVFRYRLIMEAHLGRFLLPDEVVHHINGDTSDDRIENLVVTNSRTHQRMHTLLGSKWARKYDRCRACGSNERRHGAKGLCERCYNTRKRL